MTEFDACRRQPLRIRDAWENNLQGVSLDLPNGSLTVITGASGAGKSSLVHQVIARIGSRRLGRLRGNPHALAPSYEPRVASVEGLPPIIEVRQEPVRGHIRSTVATYTGILHLLAQLFINFGVSLSPGGFPVEDLDRADFGRWLWEHYRGHSATLARVTPAIDVVGMSQIPKVECLFVRKADSSWTCSSREGIKSLLPATLWLAVPEVTRVISDEDDIRTLMRNPSQNWLWVIDGRVFVEGGFHRIARDEREPFLPLSRRLLSFNSQGLGSGCCETCGGRGIVETIDVESLVRDPDAPLLEGGLNLPRSGERFTHLGALDCVLRGLFYLHGLPEDVTWNQLPEPVREIILHGSGREPVPELHPGETRPRKAKRPFQGILPLLNSRMQSQTSSAKAFDHLQTKRACPDCGGSRYNRSARACVYRGLRLSEAVTRLTIGEFQKVVEQWQPTATSREAKVLSSLHSLLSVYVDLKLGYLQLGRSTSTLSGGESQRIKLGLALALQLTGCCYLLDEPSRALHAQDVTALAQSISKLDEGCNTVLMVEHNPLLFRLADHLVVLGPGGGHQGGKIVYAGKPEGYLGGGGGNRHKQKPCYGKGDEVSREAIEVAQLSVNNVRKAAFRVPVGRLTAVIGVSGAGKSSGIIQGLVPAVEAALRGTLSARLCDLRLPKGISFVEVVSQKSWESGRNSIVATSLQIYDQIRHYYARQSLSSNLGLTPSDFSFNAKGACPACEGTGTARDGHGNELPETCHFCGGQRLAGLPLLIRVDGLTIAELLDMSAEQLVESEHPAFDGEARRRLTLMTELGLGHLQLSRITSTLSAGERQRLRVARFMARIEATPGQGLLVLDEPTAGLGTRDAQHVFRKLAELARMSGHTLVVIEHKLDLLPSADWIIEFGPGAGPDGGKVIFQGTYSQLMKARTPSAAALRSAPSALPARAHSEKSACAGQASGVEILRQAARVFESFLVHQDVWEDERNPRPLRPTVKLDPMQFPKDARVGELLEILPVLRTRWRPVLAEGVVGVPNLSDVEQAVQHRPFGFSPVSFGQRLGLATPLDLIEALRQLQRLGFRRVWHDGQTWPISGLLKHVKNRKELLDCWVICEADAEPPLRQVALRWSHGVVRLMEGPDVGTIVTTRFLLIEGKRIARFGTLLGDPRVGDCRSPNGRCAYCSGTGRLMAYPLELIIADPRSTIEEDRFWHPSLLKAIRALRRQRLIPEAKFFAQQAVADFLQPYTAMDRETAFLLENGIPWRRFPKPGAARDDRTQDFFIWRGLHYYVHKVLGKMRDPGYKQELKSRFRWKICPPCEGTGMGWESAYVVLPNNRSLIKIASTVPLKDLWKELNVRTPALQMAMQLGLGHLKITDRFEDLSKEEQDSLVISTACSAPLENVTLVAGSVKLADPARISRLLAKQGMSIVFLPSSTD